LVYYNFRKLFFEEKGIDILPVYQL
jgi:hypothetical protein